MSDLDLQKMAAAARAAVIRAARVTARVQADLERVKVVTKDDRLPVTLADYAAQAVVAHHLCETLGDVRLVGEEQADALRDPAHRALLDMTVEAVREQWPGAEPDAVLDAIDHGTADPAEAGFWTLDPVDGTKGFLRGEQYCVSLAWIEGGRPVVGALACPNLDVDTSVPPSQAGRGIAVIAVRGQGVRVSASEEDDDGAPIARLAPSGRSIRTAESVESKHSDHGAHERIVASAGLEGRSVRLDSQAKYVVVARGQADVYLRLPSTKGYVEKIWDHAAGSLAATEAGLLVTDFAGRTLDFGQGRRLENNRGILVAGPEHHEALLAAIRDLGFA